jgi:hypothetical protein
LPRKVCRVLDGKLLVWPSNAERRAEAEVLPSCLVGRFSALWRRRLRLVRMAPAQGRVGCKLSAWEKALGFWMIERRLKARPAGEAGELRMIRALEIYRDDRERAFVNRRLGELLDLAHRQRRISRDKGPPDFVKQQPLGTVGPPASRRPRVLFQREGTPHQGPGTGFSE